MDGTNPTQEYAKKGIIIFALLVVVVFVVAGYTVLRKSAPGPEQKANIIVNPVQAEETPKGFPEIPNPADATPVSSFSTTNPAGGIQATRVFETAQSADMALAFYRDYLGTAKNGWTITTILNSLKDPFHKVVLAKNNSGVLTINISERERGGSEIAVNFLEVKK